MKSSYKSSSTNHLYEFAEELAKFNKSSTGQKMQHTAQADNSTKTYAMEFKANNQAGNNNSEKYDSVD